MILGPSSRWSRPVRWFLYGIATMSLGVLPATGQQSDQLQEQLKQLKQQYETTTHELEQRIDALEQQIEKQKAD
jgi:cell division protein FtsB